MANKIGVLEHTQLQDETPSHYIKRRVSNQLIADGYATRVSRWLIQMVSMKFKHALDSVIHGDSGLLNPEGPPECTLAKYPVKDQTSNPFAFGAHQNWAQFPA